MRPILRTWVLLLIGAIIIVGGMFWARAHSGAAAKKDPLLEAQAQVEKAFGMKLATACGPEGGLKVEAVKKGSPADLTGIKVGDRVLTVGDRSVWHVYQFSQYASEVLQSAPGVSMLVERKGGYLQVVFGRRGMTPAGAAGPMPGGMPEGMPGEAGP